MRNSGNIIGGCSDFTNLSPRQYPGSSALGTWALGKCRPVRDSYCRKTTPWSSPKEGAGRALWEDRGEHTNWMLQPRLSFRQESPTLIN